MSGGFLLLMLLYILSNTFVSSRLDYCNSLLRNLLKFNLRKLQLIQNSAAQIVSHTSRYTSITPVLEKFHWLPVELSAVFKTAKLVYKFLHTGFHMYIAPYLSSYSTSYSTRCSEGGGNFLEIRASPSLTSFRKQLKTYLYTKEYPP